MSFMLERPRALDIGKALARLIQTNPVGQRADQDIRDLMEQLVGADGQTAEDALVLTVWAGALLRQVLSECDEIPARNGQDVRYIVLVSAALAVRATAALEAATGIPAESLSGEMRFNQ